VVFFKKAAQAEKRKFFPFLANPVNIRELIRKTILFIEGFPVLHKVILSIKNKHLEGKIAGSLRKNGLLVECCGSKKNPWQEVIQSCGDVLVISESFLLSPSDLGIQTLKNLPENPIVFIIHDSDSIERNAQLLAAGADIALHVNSPYQDLAEAIESAIESRRQLTSHDKYPSNEEVLQPKLADFSSASPSMQIFIKMVQKIALSDSVLLLQGETGVGKEHLARAIHAESTRFNGPFVAVNMAALPEQLLESELFGHTRGAFTGATRARRGAFEMAHGGTIFLDEIGEMPLHFQVKLLRVLQNFNVHPLGSEKAVSVDVRVIASTNRDLDFEVRQQNFRKDLFFRLNITPLLIPPLRERREDIPTLARLFLRNYRYKIKKNVYRISESAMKALYHYDWPGNVRELMNIIERGILLADTDRITLNDLPAVFHKEGSEKKGTPLKYDKAAWMKKTLPAVKAEILTQVEKMYCEMLLNRTGGRINKAAEIAGINSRSLYNMMKKLGLRKEDFRGRLDNGRKPSS